LQKRKRPSYEYATLFFQGDFWEIHQYDWEKKDTKFSGEWVDAVAALNQLSLDGWEVVNAYYVPEPEEEEKAVPTQQYLLRRKVT
jgi:hypothetical protein